LKNQAWSTPFSIANIQVLAPWWQTWWFYLAVSIVLLFTLLRIRNSVIAKTKQSMEIDMQRRENELSEQKIRFLINVSHELRTPLTLIYAPLRRLLKDDNTPKILKPVLTLMYKHVRNMKNMIDMVLDVRKIEMNSDTLKLNTHDFNKWMLNITDDFAFEFEARNIHLNIKTDEKITQISFDSDRCDKVLSNLLMNAIKFSEAGSTVTVSSALFETCVRVTVADQGSGVSADETDKLFSRFYQGRHEKGGSGIGLSYAKAQVELHAGKIGYEPAHPQGSVFWFELPLIVTDIMPTELFKTDIQVDKLNISQTIMGNELEFDFKHMTVMIVEDEPDLLAYMKESLSEYFGKVITAINGIEAFEMIRKYIPDILISDVMMPGMDGFELCKKIKLDVIVSHIPVVLLTALSDDENSLIGYKVGADLYLAKPFGIDLLLAATANILRTRSELRSQFSTAKHELDIEDITFSNADENFLQRLNKYIESHLADNELRIDNLASEMAMSRTTFYNKVKILTGLTANNYLIDFKIKKAKNLLQKHNLPIQEIAFELGFVSQRYFSTVFKQHTGKTPTEHRESKG
jgi:signal transduction histidine kinase/DNA-binding response OmpR family regulator